MTLPSALRNIGAVIAGFLSVAVLSVVTDMIVEALGILPPQDHPEALVWWMLLIALAYRTVYTVLGGYVTAKLTSSRTALIVLGILGTLGGIAGVIGGWHLGNQWYPIAIAVEAFPCIWYGGKLAKRGA